MDNILSKEMNTSKELNNKARRLKLSGIFNRKTGRSLKIIKFCADPDKMRTAGHKIANMRKTVAEETESAEDRIRAAKKHAAMAGVAVAATASLLAVGMFNSPADLAKDPAAGTMDRAFTPAFEQVLEENEEEDKQKEKTPDTGNGGGAGAGDSDGSSGESAPAEERAADSVKNRFLQLSEWVRAALGIPVWCVGWVLLHILQLLWGSFLSPLLSSILGWGFVLILILTAVLATVKAVHPELPIRKILSRRTVAAAAIFVLVIAVADKAAGMLFPEYDRIAGMIRFSVSFTGAAALACSLIRKKRTCTKQK